MSFLSNLVSSATKPDSEGGDKEKGGSSLFADAKVVAEAAKAQFGNQPEGGYDKAKAAGSAANILEAGSNYAKLDETQGVGKYVDQAEDYLRSYSGGNTPAPAAPEADKKPDEAAPSADEKTPEPAPEKKDEGGLGK